MTWSSKSSDPLDYFFGDDLGFNFDPELLEEMRLNGLRKRFSDLRSQVPALNKLAKEQGITQIDRSEDAVPLLLPHTAFKSYPSSWIVNGEFQRLTEWLTAFTSRSPGPLDFARVDSIDRWIEEVERKSDLLVTHSFGTSGRLSFIPRTRSEWERGGEILRRCIRDWSGRGSGPDLHTAGFPVVAPTYRFGSNAMGRGIEGLVQHVARSEDNALFLYPTGRFSADIAMLAGLLHAGKVGLKSDFDLASLSPAIQSRRRQHEAEERDRESAYELFFVELERRFKGRDLYLFLLWPTVVDWATEGLKRGIRGLFGRNSILHTGGGLKGRQLPDGWKDRVFEFLGFSRCFESYGMTELQPTCPKCEFGNYHIHPLIVPYVLDPVSGRPLPREGSSTGRFAAVDLNADSFWSAIITGDRVTMDGWDRPCDCGRSGQYLLPDIQRYSELQGGSDKISCAGVPEAYERAIAHIGSLNG